VRLLFNDGKENTLKRLMISPVHTWITEKTGLLGNLNSQSLTEWQLEQVRATVEYAKKNTRFYHNLPEFIGNLEELPFTTAADLAKDPMEFLAIPRSEVARITTLTTSGTTGLKKRIFFSEGDIERIRQYFAVGMKSLTTAGQQAAILISDDTVNSLGYLLRKALERINVTSEIHYNLPDNDAAIDAARYAGCIVGMPAEVLYMCRSCPDLRPESILLTADYIPESIIKTVSETWKCEVFSHYGMTEVGFGYAVDCEHHEGHHTRDADVLVEIIDPLTGKTCKPGQKGEVVLTMFSNEAMPLIRYRTGDLSHFITTPCKCGSNLKKLGRIISRYEDDIILPDGQLMNIHLLDEILFGMPAIKGFDAAFITQEGKNHLFLVIDATDEIAESQFAGLLPPGIQIHIQYGENDPFTHRGKRRVHRDLLNPVFACFTNFGQ
jgi:phenylacetate-coenzyme A ligase PaaK-like adenylate-forming protein